MRGLKRALVGVLCLLCIGTGISMPVFGAGETMNRDAALARMQPYTERREEALFLQQRASIDVINGASGQRGAKRNYDQIVSYMGAALPDSFFLSTEDAFTAFYALQLAEQPLKAELDILSRELKYSDARNARDLDRRLWKLLVADARAALHRERRPVLEAQHAAYGEAYRLGRLSHNRYADNLGYLETEALRGEQAVMSAALARLDLYALLDMEPSADIAWENPYHKRSTPEVPPFETVLEHALSYRQDVYAARRRAEAAEAVYALRRESGYRKGDIESSRVQALSVRQAADALEHAVQMELRAGYQGLDVLWQTFELNRDVYLEAHKRAEDAELSLRLGAGTETARDAAGWEARRAYQACTEAYERFILSVDYLVIYGEVFEREGVYGLH